jgi:hypothetical protein
VTGIQRTTEKNLMVFSGRAHPQLAEEVALNLGTDLVPQSLYNFANGEIYIRYEESVRGCDAFVIQSHTAPINEWIMEHLIMVDALKRASAKRITVIGGTYFRLFPIQLIELLLRRGAQKGFLPMVYLHPYDADAAASPLEYPSLGFVRDRFADRLRRSGRASVAPKLHTLVRDYSFRPVETALSGLQIN